MGFAADRTAQHRPGPGRHVEATHRIIRGRGMSNIDRSDQVPPATEQATTPATPHRPPEDVEETYYEGSPLLRGQIGKGLLWLFAGALLIAAAIAAAVYHVPKHVPWWGYLIVVAVGLF